MYDEVDTKACVKGQEVWEHNNYGTTRTETSPDHGYLRSWKWVSKKDTDKAYVSRHVKQGSHGTADSQNDCSKEMDDPDVDTHINREEEEVVKEDEQSHPKKLVDNINRMTMKIKSKLCLDARKMARFARTAEDQAVANTMGEEMPGLDEGTIGPGLTTYSKSLQEAWQVDNQPKDEGKAVDTAVLKRSADMNTHASSQETS